MSPSQPSGSVTEVSGLNAYLARPEGGSRGAMLLLPAAYGFTAGLRQCADDIAAAGVTALAWDPFHGRDVTGLPISEIMPLLGAVTDDDAIAEQRVLIEHLTGPLGAERVGVIGWCFGGRLAFVLAGSEPRLAACVAYHPSIRAQRGPQQTHDPLALAREIAAPVQWVHPGADQVITPEIFTQLRDSLESRTAASTDIQVYPGAEHGFMERPTSEANLTATRLAWPQTLAFIRACVEG
jgi:carboxymethylenebutenolidase